MKRQNAGHGSKKLTLDDVLVSGTRLIKITFLFGTVTAFGLQRVRAVITSILIGGKFIMVNLSVFDNV